MLSAQHSSVEYDLFEFLYQFAISRPRFFYYKTAVITALLITAILYYIKLQREKRIRELRQLQASRGLAMILGKWRDDEKTREILSQLCHSSDPEIILPIVERVDLFEDKVMAYKQKHNQNPEFLKEVFLLRKRLRITFSNRDVPFSSTQMLSVRQMMECVIPHEKKEIVFSTTILNINETKILIKTPTIKKKAVNLTKYPTLTCRVSREGDGDYEFTLHVLEQKKIKNINVVVLGHTPHIRQTKIHGDSFDDPITDEWYWE